MLKLTAFQYGKTEITERMAFVDGDPQKKLPISLLFFLAETEQRKILIDVGCDTMPGFHLYEFQAPVKVLEEYGVGRDEITDVLLTHAHHDHIDSVRHYRNATIYLQQWEWESAKPYLQGLPSVVFFDEEKVITKDIVIKRIGGHTKGSGIVLIQGNTVLCGDECYTKENLSEQKPTGSSVNPANSLAFVKEYAKEGYQPILFHDPDLVGKIGRLRII